MLNTFISPKRTIDSKALIIAAMMLVMFAPNAFNFLPFMLGGAAEAWHSMMRKLKASPCTNFLPLPSLLYFSHYF